MTARSPPRLVHMPAHTCIQLGRYADASRVDELALAADDAQDAELTKQGFSITKDWRNHDDQFHWYAALMKGRGELALQTARASAKRAARGDNAFAEFVRSRPLLTLLRPERWDNVLREPIASGNKGMASLLGEYAHGVALARSGQPARAEVALSEGRVDAALAEQARAVGFGKDLDEAEPPMLAADNRLALGDMQLQVRRWAEAEQSFRADLAQHPKSGWAVRGLARALTAQGREAEARALRIRLAREWPVADTTLLAAK